MKKTFSFILAVMMCGLLNAQSAPDYIKKIMDMGQNDNRTVEYLDILCNRFGGRLVGGDNYENAAEWALKQFKEMGLDARLEEAGTMPVGFNRGPWFGKLLGADQAMTLHFVTPSYTSGTHGIERGHVVLEPRTKADFEKIKGKLKGAWVLLESKSTGWAIDTSADADKKRQDAMKENEAIDARNREILMRNRQNGTNDPLEALNEEPCIFYRELIEAGVRGIIQSAAVPLKSLYDKGVVKNPDITFETLPTLPDIKLDENQFSQIKKMVQEKRSIELEFDIRNHFKMGPVKFHNVVATLKGSKYPDESVIVSGHLDCYDVATGGVDDGSGSSVTLEAARMITQSGAKPKRSIHFILFAAEEFGLWGSTAWTKTHAKEMDKVSNIFNRDGGPLAYNSISVPKSLLKEYEKIAEPIKLLYPDYDFQVLELKPSAMPTTTGGTDATVFGVQGVPMMQMREADVKGYGFEYAEIWHTESDLFTKSFPDYQKQAAFAVAIMSLGTANLDRILPRDEIYSDYKK